MFPPSSKMTVGCRRDPAKCTARELSGTASERWGACAAQARVVKSIPDLGLEDWSGDTGAAGAG